MGGHCDIHCLDKDCPSCSETAGNVPPGASTTSPTSSESTATPDSVLNADTVSLKNGITTPPDSPYLDIVADLLLFLHGHGELIDLTPNLHIAALAFEYELADRLVDGDVASISNSVH